MIESFKLKNVEFKNRVLVASGTFGYGDEVSDLVDIGKLGGIVTKSLSMKPRDGNPNPRITETASGMLNSIGLANIGVEKFISDKIPVLRKHNTIIIANIAASSIEEYCSVLEMLEPLSGVHGFEINVSCPNVKEGGLSFGTDVKLVGRITKELRRRTQKPLIIKLTPNVTHISEFARVCESEGADAVSVINTLIGMSVNINARKPKIATTTGGLSGPAIKPIALAKVYETRNAVKIPVIGIGGICSWEDAVEFFIVGASMVQIGTANFVNPSTGITVAEGIKQYCQKNDIDDVGKIIGTLQTNKTISIIDSWL
ncbi:MAG: dihydroorotate dehydrogenase [Ignavibacteriales bacterium]|nr:dihydroorotate dehydrogenase [Ignavibacteriales bacterium]